MLVAHAELRDGCADLILDSLRERFDAAVGAIAHAKSVIGSGESSAEHVLSTAGPETVEAWQQLGQHITVVAKIAGIASQFGCRQTAAFSLVSFTASPTIIWLTIGCSRSPPAASWLTARC